MNEPIHWLLVEGIAALLGAGGLYLLVGLCFTIAGSGVPFAWRAAFDPMGWLYGALVIGIQTSVRLLNAPITRPVLAAMCISLTVFCCVQLIAAMHLRGSKAGWTPRIYMKLIAGALALAILLVGFLFKGDMMKKGDTQAYTPGLDGDNVIVLQVDPAAISGESKEMDAARQSLSLGHWVLLKPALQGIQAGAVRGRQPRVLLSFLAIGWGLIAATVAVAFSPDLPAPHSSLSRQERSSAPW